MPDFEIIANDLVRNAALLFLQDCGRGHSIDLQLEAQDLAPSKKL